LFHRSFTLFSHPQSQYLALFEMILNESNGRITMYSNKMKWATRAVGSAVISMALIVSAAGLASAASRPASHSHHRDVSRSSNSQFLFPRIGEGGLVTAVTATSVTVNRWDGKTTTYTITPTTTFTEGHASTTAASLVVGDRINIRLARRAPTTALKINIELAELTGKVTSVVGNLITITGPQGFARTIIVSDATTYSQGGAPATLADVTVGAAVFAEGTIDVNLTSLDALSIKIGSTNHAVLYHGYVTALTSTSVTLDRLNGVTEMFAITPTTTFHQGSTVLTAAVLVVGDRVNVRVNSSAPTTALAIGIELAALTGRVTAVSGNAITITTNKGFSRAITVSATTTYTMGGAPATLANVTVGSEIEAVGLIDPDLTTLDASKVAIREVGHSVTYRGVVSVLSTTSLTLIRNDGKTATFTITPSTIITEGAASMTVPSLAVGDTVDVEFNSATPTIALRINIVQASLAGKVSAVAGNLITISGPQGFARTIQVSAATTYTMGGAPASLSDVIVGSDIYAVGTIDTNQTTLDATAVTIKSSPGHTESIHGLVTAASLGSFTLNRSNGTTTTFTITNTTTFTEGSTVLTAAALAVGDSANVDVNSLAPTTALSVNIVLAELSGPVTAVSGNTITIRGGKGFARTINVTASTTYTQGGAAATLANVTVGSFVTAQGTVDPDLTSLDATSITIGK
jgi:hypothetical protein